MPSSATSAVAVGSRSTAGDHRHIDHFQGIDGARIESASRDSSGAWRSFPVQVDGDYIGLHTELELKLDPAALNVIA